MTRRKIQIDAYEKHELPSIQVQAIQYLMNPSLLNVIVSCTPIQKHNVNSTNAVVPFQADFNEEVPDFDLMVILNDMEKQENTTEKNSVAITSTNNILNNILKSMI